MSPAHVLSHRQRVRLKSARVCSILNGAALSAAMNAPADGPCIDEAKLTGIGREEADVRPRGADRVGQGFLIVTFGQGPSIQS